MSRVVQNLLADLTPGHRQVVVLHAWALVHIDDADLEFLREEVNGLQVSREDRGADAVLRRVDQLQALLFIFNLLEGDDGAEELLALHPHPVVGIRDDRRLKESANPMLVGVGIPPDTDKAAHVHRVLAYFLEMLNVLQDSHRANVGVILHGISEFKVVEDLLGEPVDEVSTDLLVHIDSLYGIS